MSLWRILGSSGAVVYSGADKIDLHSYAAITNEEGRKLLFEECWKRAEVKEDQASGFRLRIPCLDDLIALKKIKRIHSQDSLKDQADIRFLESIRKHSKPRP